MKAVGRFLGDLPVTRPPSQERRRQVAVAAAEWALTDDDPAGALRDILEALGLKTVSECPACAEFRDTWAGIKGRHGRGGVKKCPACRRSA